MVLYFAHFQYYVHHVEGCAVVSISQYYQLFGWQLIILPQQAVAEQQDQLMQCHEHWMKKKRGSVQFNMAICQAYLARCFDCMQKMHGKVKSQFFQDQVIDNSVLIGIIKPREVFQSYPYKSTLVKCPRGNVLLIFTGLQFRIIDIQSTVLSVSVSSFPHESVPRQCAYGLA